MLDWNISQDDDAPPPQEPRGDGPRRRPSWRWLAVVVLVVVGAVGGGVRWRVAQQERLLRDDLLAMARHEERVRASGQPTEARGLAAAEVPQTWLDRYLASFEPTEAAPREVNVALGEVEVTGTLALAEVLLDGQPQLRAYERIGTRWHRVPIPDSAWGDAAELRTGRLRISFRERDRAFVEALAAELPRWIGEGWLAQPIYSRLTLVPSEFAPTVSASTLTEITINSPLVAPPEHGLSGETATRLAVAHWVRPVPQSSENVGYLRYTAPRFRAALAEVAALRSALPPDAYAARVAAWKAAAVPWESPFFRIGATRTALDSWDPTTPEAVSLLAAHVLYDQLGHAQVAHFARDSVTMISWDSLFQRYQQRYTVEAEQDIRDALGLPPTPRAAMPERVPSLPQSVTLGVSNRWGAPIPVMVAGADGGPASEILVDVSSASVVNNDGEPSQVSCLADARQATLEGDWLEPGLLLRATRLRLLEAFPPPPVVAPAPAETIAFLKQSRTAELPTMRADTLLALQPDGQTVTLFEGESGTWQYYWLPTPVGEPVHLLLHRMSGNCPEQWFYLYEAGRGIVGEWGVRGMAGESGVTPLWDPRSRQIGIFANRAATQMATRLDEANEGQILSLDITLPPDSYPNYWPFAADGPLLSSRLETSALMILDMESGEVVPYQPIPDVTGQIYPFYADEREIYWMNWDDSTVDGEWPGTSVLNRETGEIDTVPGMIMAIRAGHPLALGIESNNENEQGFRYVMWDRTTHQIVPPPLDDAVELGAALLCGDNAVLYVTTSGDSWGLARWQPTVGAAPLAADTGGRPFILLACP